GLRHHAHLWPSHFQGARAHRPTLSVAALSAHRSRAAASDNGRRHRGGTAAKSSAPRAGGRLLGHTASLARPRSVRSEDLRPPGTDRHRGVRAAASAGAGGSLSRRNSRFDPVDSSRAAGSSFAARQDAQLFERDRGESRGEGSRSRSVGRTARHERESRRGYGQQYLPGPWRNPVHPARAIRAGRDQPRNRDRSRTRTRCGGCGEGPRPLRRVQRRRGISDFDQPLHLSGAECERRPRRVRDSRADHAAAQRRVLPDRRLRFCRPIPEAARLGRATMEGRYDQPMRRSVKTRHLFDLLAVALTLTAITSTAISFSSPAGAAAKGKIVLAWHAGLASRWLDPQDHDGTATPDNFLTAIHDALIKNQGTELYNHPALAEHFAVAADSRSATFTLRRGIKFHNGDPVTPQDVKFSYENYRG